MRWAVAVAVLLCCPTIAEVQQSTLPKSGPGGRGWGRGWDKDEIEVGRQSTVHNQSCPPLLRARASDFGDTPTGVEGETAGGVRWRYAMGGYSIACLWNGWAS